MYQVRRERRPTGNGLDGVVYILEEVRGGNRAEIWPALGCNCYRWQAAVQGRPIEVLYAADNLFDDSRPTRSGIPVLFPFPNRIRAGAFRWDGRDYRLPLADSTRKNAIHGFACRHPWRVLDQGATADDAWLTAEFASAVDAPDSRVLWPADHRMRLTFRLGERRLRIEADVDNPDDRPLPFGLGFHPYIRVPLVPGAQADQCWIEAQASDYWELAESLPTGRRLPVDATRDLTQPRRCTDLTLDDVLTCQASPGSDFLTPRARMRQEPDAVELRLRTSPSFRELVVFTPPHRQAFCLEPYTCVTDAVNLAEIDAGLLVLQPGAHWTGVVEFEVGRYL